MPHSLAFLATLSLLLAAPPVVAEMPRIELTTGFYRIYAEVAADNPHRMRGLMHRRSMAANQGMLFVFPLAANHCMWMRNTLLPLSVAFLDEDGRILNIENNTARGGPVLSKSTCSFRVTHSTKRCWECLLTRGSGH